ncbi:MAG: alpha-L-arabinofuranosidase C-terminal domain-containing protein [Thermoguttaceae bacterium]|jgi:hypothetical protein
MSSLKTLLKSAILWAAFASLAGAEGQEARIAVQADQVVGRVSRYLTGACIEDVNHEIYGGIYSQMIFGESFQEPPASPSGKAFQISGMWRAAGRGTATGRFALVSERPFVGRQAQQVSFDSGSGQWGIENQGLNRWGLNLVAGKPYEGYVWVRAEKPATLYAALESRDGTQLYAEAPLAVAGNAWQRLDFTLTPSAADKAGRFALKLKQPGSIVLGHAFLQPGPWGRFKGLPVRRDVAEGLMAQGITVLRYGGSMVNSGGYKWKQMIGPRDRRPPYAGTWYRYSSNGWGIVDFMAFCEAAGFQYVPAFNLGETPQDMADFMQYAKGPADSEWGRRRAADGHPQPYRLRYLELGNEERVDEKYAARFEALAKAVWAQDPEIILVVGDFAYDRPLADPFKFSGAASGITGLAGQQRIVQLAKRHNREVWFDLHVDTNQPVKFNSSLDGMFSFSDALAKIAEGARQKVVVFEFNAGNHAQKRALASALAINAIERDGRTPIVTSANGLQPDGQNDNGWDQGLLFLNPSQVWLQPPGYVTQMLSRNYLPQLVKCLVTGAEGRLDVNAKRSDDAAVLVLQVVNSSSQAVAAQIHLAGFVPHQPVAQVSQLSAPLEAVNTAGEPNAVRPQQGPWKHGIKRGSTNYAFPPHSFTVLRLE